MNLKDFEKKVNLRSKYFEEVQKICRSIFVTHPLAEDARNYVNSRISKKSQEIFEIGYFPDDDNLNLILDKISEKKLIALGLMHKYHVQNDDYRIYVNKGILSRNNIIIPYRNFYGNIVSLVGRTQLDQAQQKLMKVDKYKNSTFKKSFHLFGLHHAKEAILARDKVIIVEGQFDCISCHEFGFSNTVALGGVGFSRYHFQLLSRLTSNILLLLDRDEAGINTEKKIIKKYANFANIQVIHLPSDYKDIDEYLHKVDPKYHLDLFKETNVRSKFYT